MITALLENMLWFWIGVARNYLCETNGSYLDTQQKTFFDVLAISGLELFLFPSGACQGKHSWQTWRHLFVSHWFLQYVHLQTYWNKLTLWGQLFIWKLAVIFHVLSKLCLKNANDLPYWASMHKKITHMTKDPVIQN